jgi:hypothetical protein
MKLLFSDLFSVRDGHVVARHLVRVKGRLIPPGVIMKGLDLSEYADQFLFVEVEEGVYILKGYFKLHLCN